MTCDVEMKLMKLVHSLLLAQLKPRLGMRHLAMLVRTSVAISSQQAERSASLALLSLTGCLVLGGSLLLQMLVAGTWPASAFQTLWAQTLITALLAPPVCSLWLLLWRQQLPGVR